MKITSIKYEKPFFKDAEAGYQWQFVVETDTELPHGHNGFGGLLKRSPGGWRAKSFTLCELGPSYETREAAIAGILDVAVEGLRVWKAECASQEANRQRRLDSASALVKLLPAGVRLQFKNLDNLNEAPQYTLSLEFLNEEEVQKWTKIIQAQRS